MRLTRIITDYRLSQNEAYPLVKYIRRCVEWAADHPFWSWFDVNRSTFDEDMSRKRFSHFRSM